MLTNSQLYLCSSFGNTIRPISQIFKLNLVPRNLLVTSHESFLYCDRSENSTIICEMHVSGQRQQIEQFPGIYTSCDFCNDYALLLNREGDILFHNFLSKNSFSMEKQHPGLYSDAAVLHIDDSFITSGGCLKNQTTSSQERIIKVWKILEQQDQIEQKSRINTGHTKPIENSFVFNKSFVVTLSTDKTLRVTNVVMEQLHSLIPVDADLLAGCAIDYSTLVVGGNSKNLKIYDVRTSKQMLAPLRIESELIQVTNITRFTDSQLIFANINELHTLDLRTMKTKFHKKYEGQRISQVKVLNKRQFIVGNMEKTMQIWEAY